MLSRPKRRSAGPSPSPPPPRAAGPVGGRGGRGGAQSRNSAPPALQAQRSDARGPRKQEFGACGCWCCADGRNRAAAEDAVAARRPRPAAQPVYRGRVACLDSRQRWKRRELRCDGRLLVALRSQRVAFPGGSAPPVRYLGRRPPADIRSFDPALARRLARSAPEWRCSLDGLASVVDAGRPGEPQRPPLGVPPVTHPLFATPVEDVVLPDGGLAVRYFQDASWALPVSSITAVTRLARFSGERICGAFAVHTGGARKHVFRAADDAEAALWIGLLIMAKAAVAEEGAAPPDGSPAFSASRTPVPRGFPKLRFGGEQSSRSSRHSFPCCHCRCAGYGRQRRECRRRELATPPRTDSLLHSSAFEWPDPAPADQSEARSLGIRSARASRFGAERAGADDHRSSAPPALRTDWPFPESLTERLFPESHGEPLAPAAEEEFLPPPPRPHPVPALHLGSLLAGSPRRTATVTTVRRPAEHEALLQLLPLTDPPDGADQYAGAGFPAEAAASASSGSPPPPGDGLPGPPELVAVDVVRREIVSRAKYLLREIRCASGFIPVPSASTGPALPDDGDDGDPRRQRDPAAAVRVSRIPVVVALEHLEDVVHGFLLSGDFGAAAAAASANRGDAAGRLIAEAMRRAHDDVMKIVGDGGNLAGRRVFETAVASVELLVLLLLSADGLPALN